MMKYKRKDKNEKRRLVIQKQHARYEMNKVRYGVEGGSALVMAKTADFNRRLIAAFLTLVFVLTTILIGYNIAGKAATGSEIILDDTYTTESIVLATYDTFANDSTWAIGTDYYKRVSSYNVTGTVSVTVSNGKISGISFASPNSSTFSQHPQKKYLYHATYNKESGNNAYTKSEDVGTPILNGANEVSTDLSSYIGQDATLDNIVAALNGASSSNSWYVNSYNALKNAVIEMMEDAPAAPDDYIDIDDYDPDIPPLPDSAESYIEVNKTIAPSQDGSAYDLTLEAYSTADISSYQVLEKIPTDYIVVVDQSGSMSENDMPTSYKAAGNKTLEEINEGNYYINKGGKVYRVFAERGYLYEYFPQNSLWVYDIVSELGQSRGWFMPDTETETTVVNQYYFRESGDSGEGFYAPVTMKIKGVPLTYYINFTYNGQDGATHTFNRDDITFVKEDEETRRESPWYHSMTGNIIKPEKDNVGYAYWYGIDGIVQGLYKDDEQYTFSEAGSIRTGMFVNYPLFTRHVGYTRLVYRDDDGVLHDVPSKAGVTTAEFCNGSGQATVDQDGTTRMEYSGLLELKTDESRLASLKTALQAFAKTLEKDEDSFGLVDNRVAIVGFSSSGYNNTELLTGENLTIRNNNGVQMTNATSNDYATALVSSLNSAQDGVNPKITAAINALTANGGTQPEDGLTMAKNIMENRTDSSYVKRSGSNKGEDVGRNTVVIFFTDGQPGNYADSNQYSEANEVVEVAKELKDLDAEIFSIGVFGVSDAEALTYEAHAPTAENKAYEYETGYFYTFDTTSTFIWSTTTYHYLNRYWLRDTPGYQNTPNDTIYDYMSVVSSRYPNATDFITNGWRDKLMDDNTPENHVDKNGNPATWDEMIESVRGDVDTSKNYYRLASNQAGLIAAFRSAIEETSGDIEPETGQISENTVLKDYINTNNFNIPENATIEVKTIQGTKNSNQEIEFSDREGDSTDIVATQNGNEIIVSGFDYNDKHIASNHPGEKLVVTIHGITPKAGVTGNQLKSNTDETGIYASADQNADFLKEFPEPAIARYKYKLNVTDADADAQFNLNYALAANQGVTADFNNILVSNEGLPAGIQNRELYSAGNLNGIANATNGSTIYLEYITEQGGNGVVDPADYSLTTTIAPSSADASSYTYYLDTTDYVDLENPDPNKVLPQPDGMTVTSFSTTANGAMFVDSIANNRAVTFHLDADESPFVDSEYEFSVEVTLTGTDIASKLSALNNDNSKIQFTQFDANTIKGTVKIVYGDGNPIDTVTIKVPDGATLSVVHSDPFYTTEYISEDEDGEPAYSAHAITTATDIYIKDTVNNDVGAGVVDNDAPHVILYVLGGVGVVSAGASAAYVYRKKDEFLE